MKLGQAFVRYPTDCTTSTASTPTRTEVVLSKMKVLKELSANSLTSRKVKQFMHVILIFTHIIWFYTLLLATMLEKESINEWAQQMTTWILILNSFFYVTLIYCHYNKNPACSLKNEVTRKVLSKFYTLIYTLNIGLAYYFWIKIYPEVDKPIKERIIYVYTYPALSVVVNIFVQLQHVKRLHFCEFGDSVLFLSLYIATSNVMHLLTNVIRGPHDAARHSNILWIDSVSLRPKFFDLVIFMVLGYLQLKLTLKMISLFKIPKPATTTSTQNQV